MGKLLKIKKFTTALEVVLILAVVAVAGFGAFKFAPGIMVEQSVELDELELDQEVFDNAQPTDKLALPTANQATLSSKLFRIAGYAWNGESAIIVSNGGPKTTKGSLMELNGVNLEIVRQDWLSELKAMQMKFIEQYDKGQKYPRSDKAAFGIMIMGDGVPYYVSTMQSALNEKFGKDKYHVVAAGCVGGMSDGEDKLIGPPIWKSEPEKMLGTLISTVPGDGDWVTTLNYCFANNLKVNPDFTTYDPDAVNFYPSADDDYINSAKELIASQKNNFTVPLRVVKNGELTGETIDKEVDGCATWTPGDKMVFDALTGFTDVASTADFPNQMATTLVVFKEFADENSATVSNIFKSALTAANQMKQYDSWRRAASVAVQKTFGIETPEYWYNMYQGQTGSKAGIEYQMGGTRALNYADVMQYYGKGNDGKNRYEDVYTQVGGYLTELNPFGFNESVERLVPYEEGVELSYLENIEGDVLTTNEVEMDYSEEKTEVLARGQWSINFNTGSATILPTSTADINKIYALLIQAEQTKIQIVGHTDNTGSLDVNTRLSDARARSVANELQSRGIPTSRFQVVEGVGPSKPLCFDNSSSCLAKNRRVEVVFLQ